VPTRAPADELPSSSTQLVSAIALDSQLSTLQKIDTRIVGAESAQETVLWTQVRRELLEQDAYLTRENQSIWREKLLDVFVISISFCAFFAGIFLFMNSQTLPGYFVCGAGIATFARGWALGFLSRIFPFNPASGASVSQSNQEDDSRFPVGEQGRHVRG
jgi:hypothetical protein